VCLHRACGWSRADEGRRTQHQGPGKVCARTALACTSVGQWVARVQRACKGTRGCSCRDSCRTRVHGTLHNVAYTVAHARPREAGKARMTLHKQAGHEQAKTHTHTGSWMMYNSRTHARLSATIASTPRDAGRHTHTHTITQPTTILHTASVVTPTSSAASSSTGTSWPLFRSSRAARPGVREAARAPAAAAPS
jgi:hypothetical protein